MRPRLRPSAPIAKDAILVGDPGRAMMLAQELIEQPKMSNHARGLWGYSGESIGGRGELTIQSTGIGGPSAALVLGELAGHGVGRVVRVGTCLAPGRPPGSALIVERAIAAGGSAAAFGLGPGAAVEPDAGLTARLRAALASGEGPAPAAVASVDLMPTAGETLPDGAEAADMQTVAVLARAASLGIAAAAILIADPGADAGLSDESLEEAAKRAGHAAAAALQP